MTDLQSWERPTAKQLSYMQMLYCESVNPHIPSTADYIDGLNATFHMNIRSLDDLTRRQVNRIITDLLAMPVKYEWDTRKPVETPYHRRKNPTHIPINPL